jgi:hypothetical protein
MSRESLAHIPRRKAGTLLTLLSAGFLAGCGTERPNTPDAHLLPSHLTELENESRSDSVRAGYTFEVANHLDLRNRLGMNVAPAIRELSDPAIRPDLVETQLYFFVRMAGNGSELSAEEKRAIAEVARNWPDRFDPYFRREGEAIDTRAELIDQLLDTTPSLRRYLQREETLDEVATRAT